MEELYIQVVIVIGLTIYLVWKIYHLKYLTDNKKISLKREYVATIYAALVIIILIVIIKFLGGFAGIYIVIPLSVVGMYLLRKNEGTIQGFCLCLKGIYYLILSIYSIVQYYSKSEKLAELAIGFTISLAIFESVTALSDGIEKIENKRLKCNK